MLLVVCFYVALRLAGDSSSVSPCQEQADTENKWINQSINTGENANIGYLHAKPILSPRTLFTHTKPPLQVTNLRTGEQTAYLPLISLVCWPPTTQNMAILMAFIHFKSLPDNHLHWGQRDPTSSEAHLEVKTWLILTETPHMATSTPLVYVHEGTSLVSLCLQQPKRPTNMLLEKVRRRKTMGRLDTCVLQKGAGQVASDNHPLVRIILGASRNNIIRKR